MPNFILNRFFSFTMIAAALVTVSFTTLVQTAEADTQANAQINAHATSAKRIVALSPHGVEMLYAIGAGDRIVATTDYADYPESAKFIPRIGGYYGIQIERIIELNPDLVVVWASGNKLEDINQIKQLGFTVFNSDPKSLDDVATEIEQLGLVTGQTQQAQQVAADYRQQLADIRQQHKLKTEVKVFYQLWSTPLMTVSKGSWIQHIIEACNGTNVFYNAASEYPQISIENVLLTDAEVILQSLDEGNVMGVNWSQWPELPAVKNKHIYQLDADVLHRASPRAIEGVKLVCDTLDKARNLLAHD
ncbi:cobalamin-binding protein [Shewanella sp. OMA3-2]|uniref:cobalamin-binding protein n=1 Tax=Shewanella sp. OMA3-2 TaxID=2908650 RepID=UPI001F350865|nr:cobalamin-binding protein [Shewanella sp. OMA3-2]UJF22932.1 cobalamin-binding protein [Shewanella sp. OMA3-2]